MISTSTWHSRGLWTAIALLGSTMPARADSPPAGTPILTSPADAQAVLDERSTRAQVWQYGWAGVGYAMASGFALGAISTSDSEQRLDFAFAAGGIFVDTNVHMLSSIHPRAAARARVGDARLELQTAAEAEAKRSSLVFGHLLPDGLATVSGLALWLGFGHLQGAVINTVAGILTNEVRALTQPTSARDAWSAAASGTATPTWTFAFWGTGGGLVGSF
jgi:hypothetical protein